MSLQANTTTATDGFTNASNSIGSEFFLILIVVVALVVAATLIAPILGEYRIVTKILNVAGRHVYKALLGGAAVVCGGIVVYPVYWVVTADSSTQSMAMEYVGYGVGGFFVLVVVGHVVEAGLERYVRAHPEYESVGELFGGAEADD